jgi:hypothetical protein
MDQLEVLKQQTEENAERYPDVPRIHVFEEETEADDV